MKILGMAVMSFIFSLLVYAIPIVRHLLWLNAAAISVAFRRPGLFVPAAVAIFTIIFAVIGAVVVVWSKALGLLEKDKK